MEKNCLFTDIVEDPEILKALERMKFTHPTPVQEESIRPMMSGMDVTVQAPTGTGKTGAFSIPMIQSIDPTNKAIQAIVLSPTRELAIQISEVVRDLSRFKPGIRVVTIYGGERIEKQFAALRKRPQIVIATPGRLIDHMQRRTIGLSEVKVLVLDEADRMLDMGFRPDLNRILKEMPEERQTALYSATLSPEIMGIAKTYQKNAKIIKVKQDTLTVESVEQYYTIVNRNCKNPELVALLRRDHPKLSLVFTNTKRMSERVVSHLKREGYNAAFLHGDLRQAQRNRVMSQYRTGKLDVLVATDVAARGIDVENIDMVVNYDLPREEDSYIHRIGRTGRADQTGVAHTFIYRGERREIESLMRSTKAKMIQLQPTVQPEDPLDNLEDYEPSSSQPARRKQAERRGQQFRPKGRSTMGASRPKVEGASGETKEHRPSKPRTTGGQTSAGKPHASRAAGKGKTGYQGRRSEDGAKGARSAGGSSRPKSHSSSRSKPSSLEV